MRLGLRTVRAEKVTTGRVSVLFPGFVGCSKMFGQTGWISEACRVDAVAGAGPVIADDIVSSLQIKVRMDV